MTPPRQTFGPWPELLAAARNDKANQAPPRDIDDEIDDELEAASPRPLRAHARARAPRVKGLKPKHSRETVEALLAWDSAVRALGSIDEIAARLGITARTARRTIYYARVNNGYRHHDHEAAP